MDPLEEFHQIIDKSDWDIKQESLINKSFQEINDKLAANNQTDLLRKSEVERWVFLFNKNPEKGLSYKMAGTKKLENGDEVPFVFPDKNELNEFDFKHIAERFQNAKNLYAKTEYGLVLYHSGLLKNKRDDSVILLKDLFALAKKYYEKSLLNNDKDHYFLYFKMALANALKIGSERRSDEKIKSIFNELVLFTADVHNNWDIQHKSTLRSVIDLTEFAVDYIKYFKELISLEKFLDQNYNAALEVAKAYNWGAIYICDISQRLADTMQNKKYNWQILKAQQFEAMVQPAIDSGNMAAVSFIESALSVYKKIKAEDKIIELSKRYAEVRKIFRMGQVKQELPEAETKRITEIIEKEVKSKSSKELVEILCLTPMFTPLSAIEKNAEELYTESSLSKLFPSSIIDKHGNTVDVFVDEDEKKRYQFWETYNFSFQISSQTLVHFFFEGIKANKITYDAVINFLNQTWIGKTYHELYNGYEHKICPLDVLKPGIELFFNELEKWKLDNKYPASFIASTDALVTKSEYILRFFCKLLDIPTFIDKMKGSHKIKMEKNIDELLRALGDKEKPIGFLEDHRIYIQFILSQKSGYNLRNRIAHGLMDAHEYSVVNPILLITIFLKLASYNFKS